MPRKMINFVPALFVGLGGTGQRVVGRIKERFAFMFPDVHDLPVYYLVLDTDSQQRTLFQFRPDEYIEISNFDGAAVLNRLERYPMIRQWWPENLGPADVGNVDFGAGQTRPVGRLAFFYWYPQVLQGALERKTKELTKYRSPSELQALEDRGIALEDNTVAVYVVCSLAGGTGSGLVLDVAFEIRNHLKQRKGLEMVGIFVMAEGYRRVVPKGLQVERVQANTYAALKEIDHFLDAQNAARVTLQYTQTSRPFHPEEPLFDSVSLVDIIDAQGNELEHVEQLYEMIASKLTLEMFVAGERRSVMRNIRIRREIVLGRRRHYDSFGVGALVFHAGPAAQYGRLRVAEEMLHQLTSARPVDKEVKAFLVEHKLEEHGADLLLNQFRRHAANRLRPLLRPEPQDVDRALPEANGIRHLVGQEMEKIKRDVERAVERIRKSAGEALAATIRERLRRPGRSVKFLLDFVDRMRRYVQDVLMREMEKEKKTLDVEGRRGRMEEALVQLRQAVEGVWLPVVKARNVRVRFRRWYSNMEFWTDGWTETLVRDAAQQVFAAFGEQLAAWEGRLRRLEDVLAQAAFLAHVQAEQVLEQIRQEIQTSFQLIEGVVNADPIPGEKGTRFDKIIAEFKPSVEARIEELLPQVHYFSDWLLEEKKVLKPEEFLRDVVLPLLEKDFQGIHDVDILEAVKRWNPQFDVKRALANIVRQCRPFLSVDREALGEERRPESVFFVGVPDPQAEAYAGLFKEEVLGVKVQPVATGDRSRIIVLVTEIGYPSHIVGYLEDYRHHYRSFQERAARGEPEFMHLHKEWVGEALPELLLPES